MPFRLAGALLLALLLTPPVAAQAPGQQTLIGAFGGINFAKFVGDDVGDVDTRTGIQAGLFASLPLGRYFALVPSIGYSQQGTSVDVGGGTTGTFRLDYIEVPVLLKLSAPLAGPGRLRPYLVAGPSLGLEVSCELAASNGSQSAEADCNDATLGVDLDTKAVQVSAVFGAGMDIGRVTVGLRYQLGLSSIDDTGADADIKNRVLAITAGYGFRIGH